MKDFLRSIGWPLKPTFQIDSLESMAEVVEKLDVLPFFPNNIKGLSIEEMCVKGMLFGGNYEEGCWEWKGPVIRRHTSAYGKFFRRKAGFVSIRILPDFLNYRRNAYPVKSGTTEEMLLDIIKENDSLTSTELKKLIFGSKERNWDEIPEGMSHEFTTFKSKSLESPLQRLQMGGWIIISDFEYKKTKRGERYGWGVARYSTPEISFGDSLSLEKSRHMEDSLELIISGMRKEWPGASRDQWRKLLK